jgi:hypothetical protein
MMVSTNNLEIVRKKYPEREIVPNEAEYRYSENTIQCHAQATLCAYCNQPPQRVDGETGEILYEGCTCENYEPRRCRQPSRPGFLVCRYHGAGKIGGPSGGRPITTGQYSRYIKELGQSAERFRTFLEDPMLMSVRSEFSLLADRNAQLVELKDWGGVSALSDAWKDLVDGLQAIERGAIESGLVIAKETINALERDREIYDEIRTNTKEMRQLADVERKREAELSLVVRVAALMVLLEQIVGSFNQIIIDYVPDEKLRHTLTSAFAAEIRGHVSRAVSGQT